MSLMKGQDALRGLWVEIPGGSDTPNDEARILFAQEIGCRPEHVLLLRDADDVFVYDIDAVIHGRPPPPLQIQLDASCSNFSMLGDDDDTPVSEAVMCRDPALTILFGYQALFAKELRRAKSCRRRAVRCVDICRTSVDKFNIQSSGLRQFLRHRQEAFRGFQEDFRLWLDSVSEDLIKHSAALERTRSLLDTMSEIKLHPALPPLLAQHTKNKKVPLTVLDLVDAELAQRRLASCSDGLAQLTGNAKKMRGLLEAESDCFTPNIWDGEPLQHILTESNQLASDLVAVVEELERDHTSIATTASRMHAEEVASGEAVVTDFEPVAEAQVRKERHPALMAKVTQGETILNNLADRISSAWAQWSAELPARMKWGQQLHNLVEGDGELAEEKDVFQSQLAALESDLLGLEALAALPEGYSALVEEIARRRHYGAFCMALAQRFNTLMERQRQREESARATFHQQHWPTLLALGGLFAPDTLLGSTMAQAAGQCEVSIRSDGFMLLPEVEVRDEEIRLRRQCSLASPSSDSDSCDWADVLDDSEILLARGDTHDEQEDEPSGVLGVSKLEMLRWLAGCTSGHRVSQPAAVTADASTHAGAEVAHAATGEARTSADVATHAGSVGPLVDGSTHHEQAATVNAATGVDAVATASVGTHAESEGGLSGQMVDQSTHAGSEGEMVDQSTDAGGSGSLVHQASGPTEGLSVLVDQSTQNTGVEVCHASTDIGRGLMVDECTHAAADVSHAATGPCSVGVMVDQSSHAVASSAHASTDVHDMLGVASGTDKGEMIDKSTNAAASTAHAATSAPGVAPVMVDQSAHAGCEPMVDQSTHAGCESMVDQSTHAGCESMVDQSTHVSADTAHACTGDDASVMVDRASGSSEGRALVDQGTCSGVGALVDQGTSPSVGA
eukprot:CAMPEP_0114551970 /NCGR_PEP_ID=MMETSP0114-20121206/6879_1 /TAXON_ID=31324 /ORGANISM="Goniomonas sp, Strain m" /LENGTH=904 /DNA_ID=CAMNT_0001736823 /DNA_START=23 /DNA_END=2734 /DNA_ORIENTATION=-